MDIYIYMYTILIIVMGKKCNNINTLAGDGQHIISVIKHKNAVVRGWDKNRGWQVEELYFRGSFSPDSVFLTKKYSLYHTIYSKN